MKKLFLCVVLGLVLSLLTMSTIGVCKDLQEVTPEPPSFNGCIKSLRDCRKYTLVSGLFIGEMSNTRNPDGSWSTVFVCMHYIFSPVSHHGNHLGVSSLNLVSYDSFHLSGSVVQHGVSYVVSGWFFSCGVFWSAFVSWNHGSYSVSGVLV